MNQQENKTKAIEIENYDGPILQTPQLNYKVIDRVYLDSGCHAAVQMDLEFASAEVIQETFIFHDFILRDYEGIEIQLFWIRPAVLRLILTTTQEQNGLLDLLSLDDVIRLIEPSEKKSDPNIGTGVNPGEDSSTSQIELEGPMDEFWEHVQEVDLSERPFCFHTYGSKTSKDSSLDDGISVPRMNHAD